MRNSLLVLRQSSMFGRDEPHHAAHRGIDFVRNPRCSAVGVQRRYRAYPSLQLGTTVKITADAALAVRHVFHVEGSADRLVPFGPLEASFRAAC